MNIELLELVKEERDAKGELENLEFELCVDKDVFYVICYIHEDKYIIQVFKTVSRNLIDKNEVADGYITADDFKLNFYDYANDYDLVIEKIQEIIRGYLSKKA